MEDILTKWEWIAKKCEELKAVKSAEIARKIDKALTEIYGRKHTREWEDFYFGEDNLDGVNTNKLLPIVNSVIYNSSYCIACYIDAECEMCRFGHKYGICKTGRGLYQKFVDEFIRETRSLLTDHD